MLAPEWERVGGELIEGGVHHSHFKITAELANAQLDARRVNRVAPREFD
jgi:hypothetical protein